MSKKSSVNINKTVMGLVAYAFLEGTIDSLVSSFGGSIAGNIGVPGIEAALGYFLMKKGGTVGSIGRAMFTINSYRLVKGFVGSGFSLLSPQTATASGGW